MYNEHVLSRYAHLHTFMGDLKKDYDKAGTVTYTEVSASHLSWCCEMGQMFFMDLIAQEMGLWEPELEVMP